MRSDRTAQLLYLLDAVENRSGESLSRPDALAWITAKLDDGLSLEQVLECYDAEQKSRSITSRGPDAHGY